MITETERHYLSLKSSDELKELLSKLCLDSFKLKLELEENQNTIDFILQHLTKKNDLDTVRDILEGVP